MHQMQLTYVPTEDRILFRLNTKARQEFRFWMTRRYSEILWNTLTKVLSEADQNKEGSPGEPELPAAKDSLVESAKQEIKHKEVVSQSDFKTQYQESTYLPLGEEPALLFSVGVKPNPAGQALLGMHPEKGQGIEMVLNEQILHSLCKLLLETTSKANWKLDLKFVKPGDSSDEQGGGLN